MMGRVPLRLLQRSLPRLCKPPGCLDEVHKNTMIFSLGSRAAKNFWWNRWSLAALFSLDFGSGFNEVCYCEESPRGQYMGGKRGYATGDRSVRTDLYETLGLQKGASTKDIKSAYYQLAKKYHPDVNMGNPDAEKKFQEVQQAYEVLKDDKKRALYDQVGQEAYEQATTGSPYAGNPYAGSSYSGGGSRGFEGFSETIFGNGFGGGMDEMFKMVFGDKVAVHQNQNVEVTVELTFREAVEGCSKQVSFSAPIPCSACNGRGFPPGARPQTCSTCGGRGRVVMRKAFLKQESTCPSCGGRGQTAQEHCHQCQGSGTVQARREVRVNIPPGVETGVTFRVRGGDGQENLIIRVQVLNDRIFRREGADVHVDVPISISQAVLGGQVQVPTLTGDVVLKIRPGTQPGQMQVMRGKGIKMLDSNQHGDQYVHINVIIPMNISQRQQMLMQDFAREENRDGSNAATGSG
ncbi:unnamed protein product [Sphagnum troendelagicum]